MSKTTVEKVPSTEDRTLPIFAEFDKITDRIRVRAFELFSRHGFGDGHELEDWLKAEREICWPAAEFVEDDDAYTLKIALAGFDDDDITVTATPRELIVKATQDKLESSESGEDEKAVSTVHWSEMHYENVYRHVDLPADVEVENVAAVFKKGLLTVTAPKAKAAKKKPRSKKVEVSTAA